MPVFAGFNAGIGAILGPTGGFLWGFILLVAGCGIANIIERRKIAALSNEIDKGKSDSHKGKIGAGTLLAVWSVSFAGLLLCHACGVLNYCFVTGAEAVPAILSVSLPFLPKDMLSVIGAYYLAKALNSRMRRVRAA